MITTYCEISSNAFFIYIAKSSCSKSNYEDTAMSALLRCTADIFEYVQELLGDLMDNGSLMFLLNGRINQEYPENPFSHNICEGRHRFDQSARDFALADRSLTTSMLMNPIPSANCIDEQDDLLSDLGKISTNDASMRRRRNEVRDQGERPARQARQSETDALVMDIIDDFHLSVTVVNAVAYVAGYIIRKIKL